METPAHPSSTNPPPAKNNACVSASPIYTSRDPSSPRFQPHSGPPAFLPACKRYENSRQLRRSPNRSASPGISVIPISLTMIANTTISSGGDWLPSQHGRNEAVKSTATFPMMVPHTIPFDLPVSGHPEAKEQPERSKRTVREATSSSQQQPRRVDNAKKTLPSLMRWQGWKNSFRQLPCPVQICIHSFNQINHPISTAPPIHQPHQSPPASKCQT